MAKWNNNVIESLQVDGINIVLPWGVEFADSNSFYSLEKGYGQRYEEQIIKKYSTASRFITKRIIKLSEGKFKLKTNDTAVHSSIYRELRLELLTDSYLMDFVTRYRFKKEVVGCFEIGGEVIHHTDSNIYYQHEVRSVTGHLVNGKKIVIEIDEVTVPEGMKCVMYVRDQVGEWVVHCRFIPTGLAKNSKDVIKVCTDWAGTRPLPDKLTKYLLSSEAIKRYLWYKAEFRPYKYKLIKYLINLSAYSMIKIPCGTILDMKTRFFLE
ncbi:MULTISPECIES: hypothetical protein [unclassified Endozoicomonas]|uniref:hypothetical protein n=1 Tax=unclassified Endozoicomonas TaxID=2644528 RepID=UPI0021480F65|nr:MULTISPECIES: hypothetical protein [unclassified Endozoicomonas]